MRVGLNAFLQFETLIVISLPSKLSHITFFLIQISGNLTPIFVPTFEENEIFILGVVFYSVNFHRSK